MKVLVLGGGGYVGRVLLDQLIDHGHTVSVYDTFWFGNLVAKANVIVGDIRNYTKLEAAIKEHDAVINIAAIVGDEACNLIENQAKEINTEAAVKVAQFCNEYKKKLAFSSTCFVYGFNEKEILTERSRTSTSGVTYPDSKVQAEKGILSVMNNATILRFGTLFGKSPRMRYDLVANIFTAKALKKETLTVFGGHQWRPLLHVEDAAAALIHCIHNDLSGTYNVLHANYQISTIAEIIAAKTDAEIMIDSTKQDTRSYLVSNKQIRKTGFETKHNIVDLVDEIKEEESWKKYSSPIYSNAKFFTEMQTEGKL